MGKIGDKLYSVYFYLLLIFIYAPIIVLVIFSFNDSTILSFPLKGFTLRWYQELFQLSTAISAIQNTFLLAGITSAVATVFGLSSGLAVVRYSFPGRKLFQTFILLPMLVPYLITGVAMMLFLRSLGIDLSLGTILIGHILIAIPYSTLVLTSRLIGFDISLEEAAMDLGASKFTAFRTITLPIIKPGVLVAAILTFTVSFENIELTYFLAGEQITVPLFVYGMLRYPRMLPILTSLSVVMLTFVIVLALIMRIIEKE